MKVPFSLSILVKPAAVCALALSGLVFAACGESSQEKAQAQVCGAREEINKEVKTLTGLTVTTASVNQVKSSVEAIVNDVKKIKEAQPNLAPARKEQVQSANEAFESEITKIVSGLASNLSLSNAEGHLKSAVTELAASYKKTLAPISCS